MNYRTREAAGGARGPLFMGRTSQPAPAMSTPQPVTDQPNGSRRDVRAAVCALVIRLTMKLLEPGAGVLSKDPYVANIRRDIAKGPSKSAAVQQIAAVAYDDVMHKGRSAADVKGWLLELCEEIDAWESERDGSRIAPPDLMPLLRVESRREGLENEASLMAADNQDCPEVLERLIETHEAEIDASEDVVELARRRLVLMRREA